MGHANTSGASATGRALAHPCATGSSTLALHGIARQQACVTEVGTGIDGDGDGIPNSGTWTYACTEAADGFTAQGTVTLADDNESDPNSGCLLTISEDSERGGTIVGYALAVETSTPLAISSPCMDGNVESGTVVYSDTEGNALTVSFSNCTASTSYDGS